MIKKFRKDEARIAAVIASVVVGLIYVVLWNLMGETSLVIVLPLALLVILLFVSEAAHQLDRVKRNREYFDLKQMQSFHELYHLLDIRHPIPHFAKWAIYPDFAGQIVSAAIKTKPKHVFELGSGISTVINCYCLEKLGGTRVTSLDNDAVFAEVSRKRVQEDHGFKDMATVHHAPLVDVEINGNTYKWYDMSVLDNIEPIDMLIVDGPPAALNKHARYPAIPKLYEYLSPNAVILVDDANREDEKEMVEMWCKEFPALKAEFIDTQTGLYILRKEQ